MNVVVQAGWRLELPEALIVQQHVAADFESGCLARGWIGEAPLTVTVQERQLEHGFNEWVRQMTSFWLEAELPRRIIVSGATDAVRIDGAIEFDGLGAAGERERCIAVYAKRRRRAVVFTIRFRPEDDIGEALEAIVASFAFVS